MKKLTPMHQKILAFIKEFNETKGYSPSVREICAAVGLRSPSTVHCHLKNLQEAGYLVKDGNKTRSLTLPSAPKPASIPVLGRVAAGEPIWAQQNIERYISFDQLHPGGEYFALEIQGDSMIGAGILPGDTVIVRRQQTAFNGEIVVALIGDEATCKRFHRVGREVWLLPENERYQPIDGSQCTILGVVAGLQRIY